MCQVDKNIDQCDFPEVKDWLRDLLIANHAIGWSSVWVLTAQDRCHVKMEDLTAVKDFVYIVSVCVFCLLVYVATDEDGCVAVETFGK